MDKNYDVIKTWLQNVTTSSPPAMLTVDVRLPRHVIPSLYEIELQPNMYSGDPENFTFDGKVTIHIDCKESTNSITLHSNKLDIPEKYVSVRQWNTPSGINAINVTSLAHDQRRQFVVLTLDQNLIVGHAYVMTMKFKGPLKNDLAGLYLSTYKRGDESV